MTDASEKTTAEGSAGGTAAPAATRRGRLRPRDLLNVAIFAVIYIVIVYAMNMIGLISPIVMFVALLASIVVAGIPFMLFLARTRRFGLVSLFGLVVGIVWALTGLGWITGVFSLVLGVIADLILRAGDYRSRWAAIWANTVYAVWFIAPMLPILVDREAYLTSSEMSMNSPEYVAEFDQLVTLQVVWGYNIATVVFGFLGGLLGAAMLKKHFVRAGLA